MGMLPSCRNALVLCLDSNPSPTFDRHGKTDEAVKIYAEARALAAAAGLQQFLEPESPPTPPAKDTNKG